MRQRRPSAKVNRHKDARSLEGIVDMWSPDELAGAQGETYATGKLDCLGFLAMARDGSDCENDSR